MKSLRLSRLACLFVGLLTLTFVPRAAADCDQLLKKHPSHPTARPLKARPNYVSTKT